MFQIEYRAVIKFFTKEGLSPVEVKKRLDGVYGNSSPSYSTVKHWATLFNLGQETLEDDPDAVQLANDVTADTFDLRDTQQPNNNSLKLCRTRIIRNIKEHLNLNKASAICVQRLLTVSEKAERVMCCRQFLDEYKLDPENFLKSIVTGSETMVLYYDRLPKKESMGWRKADETLPRNSGFLKPPKMMMTTIFWDARGILLIDYKERNTTVSAQYYAALMPRLRDAIKHKRRGKYAKGIRLLHDNTPVHTDLFVKTAVRQCGFSEISNPPYSPDLVPSDYYLISKLKSDLRGRKFQIDDDLQAAVEAHFATKEEKYFYKGIEMLPRRFNKCIELNGEYIEKP